MKSKKMFAFALVLVMAVLLTTCTKNKSSDGSGEEILLSVALNMDIREAFEEFFAAFEKANPGVKIDLVDMPALFEEFLQARVAQGNLPDVFSISGNAYGSDLADNDMIMDLRDTIAAQRIIDSVKPGFTSKEKGKLFGITYGIASSLLFCNLEIFEAAGVTELPTDWRSFLEICAKIKAWGATPILLTLGDGTIGNTAFSYGFGNNVVNNNPNWKRELDAGTFNFDIPEIVDIFERIKYLLDQGYAQDGAISTQEQQGLDLFTQGQAAMYFGGTWYCGVIEEAAGFDYDVCIPPWNDDPKIQNVAVGAETGWGVSANTAHPEVALKLMDFFTGEGYLILQHGRMNIPAVKDFTGIILPPQVENILPVMLTADKTSQLYYEYLPLNIMENLHRLFQDVANGTLTPVQAATELNKMYRES